MLHVSRRCDQCADLEVISRLTVGEGGDVITHVALILILICLVTSSQTYILTFMYLKKLIYLHVLTGLHWVEEQANELVELLACGAIGPEFDSWSRLLPTRDIAEISLKRCKSSKKQPTLSGIWIYNLNIIALSEMRKINGQWESVFGIVEALPDPSPYLKTKIDY